MDKFNDIISDLPFKFNVTEYFDNEIIRLNEKQKNSLSQPIDLINFVLYYPISNSDEFIYGSIQYIPKHRISPLEIIQTIKKIYQTSVGPANLSFYATRYPEIYNKFLRTHHDILLSDVIGNRCYISSLIAYKDGYLLNLIS